MRFWIPVFSIAISLAATTTPVCAATTHIINVGPGGGMTFAPATLTIPPGDTITFQSAGGLPHNAVSDDGTTFSSGTPNSSAWTYVTPALSAGTYGFHCTVHGNVGSGMFGTITVQLTPVTLQSFNVD